MKTTKRFEESVAKLYEAFNTGKLNAFDCRACAIGNMLGTGEDWAMNNISIGKLVGKYFMYSPPIHKDYTEEELFNTEKVFLTEWKKKINWKVSIQMIKKYSLTDLWQS